MPQREFWTERHVTELHLTMRIDPADPEASPIATVKVNDQAGETMTFAGATLPAGFAAWAMADACKAALEAWDAGTPDDVRSAWARTISEWKRSVRELNLPSR